LSPEVVQTSDTDCGPATLKCMLDGFGLRVSYGRLREACQTDVDGTSINAVEHAAEQLGLLAEQTMVPVDHVLLAEASTLPAIAVVRLPDSSTHFVVLWRRYGRYVQIMDPAAGRRWLTAERFLSLLYVHSMQVSAAAWRSWAGSDSSRAAMRRRMTTLGMSEPDLLDQALTDASWRGLSSLDAALRMTDGLVRSGALSRGREATRAVERLYARPQSIPAPFWSVREGASPDQLTLRGAVLVNVHGRAKQSPEPASVELRAALAEVPIRPGAQLLRLLRADGVLIPSLLLSALLLAAAGVIAEAILLRGFLEMGRELGLAGQRLAAVTALLAFFSLLLVLELPLTSSLFRYGRRLEIRLRQAFLEKIPRLSDRYFRSRLASDMAERSHTIHTIRHLPELGSQLIRGVFELILTTIGIVWLDPAVAPLATAAAAVAFVMPLAAQPVIMERDLRARTIGGALSRFSLDALLGLVPIRAHGGERAVRRAHAAVLEQWARAGLTLQRAVVGTEVVQLAAGYGFGIWLLVDHLARRGEAGSVLLLAYWVLNLPTIGQQIGSAAWQYPAFRSITLRLLEPLGALEESTPATNASGGRPQPVIDGRLEPADLRGASITFDNIRVVAGGHTILDDISCTIEPGSHVAIVGPSGAGKSTLVGLLMGWHRPARGTAIVDGSPLGGQLADLRRQTAWVDPSVHLWNRSVYENLFYGTSGDTAVAMSEVVDVADLRQVLERLPNGFESSLGEGGGLVSGGEGQRVRLGRSLLRPGVRLVILDEAFRGLASEQRRDLLARARFLWRDATLFCITHDVAATQVFDRVLVLESGRLVEDGIPDCLASQPDSRYRTLLDAESSARHALWSDPVWRRLHLDTGRIQAAGHQVAS
jgi:ATP-binding cassette subfamily B protein